MLSVEESKFIDLIGNNRIVLNCGKTPELKTAKKKAWKTIVEAMNVEKENGWNEDQLYKKWINIKSRVFEKNRKRKATGGGCAIAMTENDSKVLNILGENNPKLHKIPNALSLGGKSSTEVQSSMGCSSSSSKQVQQVWNFENVSDEESNSDDICVIGKTSQFKESSSPVKIQ